MLLSVNRKKSAVPFRIKQFYILIYLQYWFFFSGDSYDRDKFPIISITEVRHYLLFLNSFRSNLRSRGWKLFLRFRNTCIKVSEDVWVAYGAHHVATRTIVTLIHCNSIRVAYTRVSCCPRGRHVDCKNIPTINHEPLPVKHQFASRRTGHKNKTGCTFPPWEGPSRNSIHHRTRIFLPPDSLTLLIMY